MSNRVTVSSLLDSYFLGKKHEKSINEASDDTKALASGEVSVDNVIDKLNSIRSGKSFNDESISSGMETWFNKLSEAEKTALLSFLKAIAQIVTGEIPANKITDPSDDPSNVKMQKQSKPLKISIKPNVIKGPQGSDEVDVNNDEEKNVEEPDLNTKRPQGKKGVENNAGPVPVKPRSRR